MDRARIGSLRTGFGFAALGALGLCLSSASACKGDGDSSTSSSSASSSASTGGSGGSGGGLVCTAPSITKGPWALRVDDTSAEVRWEACASGADPKVNYRSEGTGGEASATSTETPITLASSYAAPLNPAAAVDWAGTYYTHKAPLTGLQPGTCYHYSLNGDATREGRFCTAHPSGTPVKFMAIADTNPGLGFTAGVLAHALPENPEFIVHGGDIQYYDSRLETWASWFPLMQPLLSQGAFFPAIGNHEDEMSQELSDYSLRFFGDAGFDGSDTYYRFENSGIWFFSVNTQEPVTQGSAQASWLETELAKVDQLPGFRFSVVFFHRPFVTCGDTGDDPAARDFLEPVFLQHHVLFVLQAHMHGYERFQFDNGMTYLTVGGGGGIIGDVNANISRDYCNKRVVSGPWYHSVIFNAGADSVDAKVIDKDGKIRDTFGLAIPSL